MSARKGVHAKELRTKRVFQFVWRTQAMVFAQFCMLVLFSLSARAQVQAIPQDLHLEQPQQETTLPTPALWLKPGVQGKQGAQPAATAATPIAFAANYPLPEQTQLHADIAQLYTYAPQQTIALVIVPRFEEASGKAFLRLGNIALFDDHSRNGYGEEGHNFVKGQPTILVFRSQATPTFGKTAATAPVLANPELFDIAELWVTNELLSDDQARHLETYLALKYAVNITRNKEARYRNYFTAAENTQWHNPTEGRYNKHVLGLGRLDAFDWHQTQTQTNTAAPVTLALDAVQPQGQMPEVTLAEGSQLIFAKAASYQSSICPVTQRQLPFYGWKIKRTAWQSNARYMHMVAHRGANAAVNPKQDTVWLTDGTKAYYLPVQQNGNNLQITIPLTLLADDVHYFLMPTAQNATCEELIYTLIDSTTNTLGLAIDPGLLPLNAELLGLSNHTANHFAITDPYIQLNTGASGQYQLNLYTTQGNLAYTTLANTTGNTTGGMSTFGTIDPGQLTNTTLRNVLQNRVGALQPALQAYPNPAAPNKEVTFQLLNPDPGTYTIRVVEQSGRILHQTKQDIATATNSWGYRFAVPGAYTVVYTLGDLSLSQTVIIN